MAVLPCLMCFANISDAADQELLDEKVTVTFGEQTDDWNATTVITVARNRPAILDEELEEQGSGGEKVRDLTQLLDATQMLGGGWEHVSDDPDIDSSNREYLFGKSIWSYDSSTSNTHHVATPLVFPIDPNGPSMHTSARGFSELLYSTRQDSNDAVVTASQEVDDTGKSLMDGKLSTEALQIDTASKSPMRHAALSSKKLSHEEHHSLSSSVTDMPIQRQNANDTSSANSHDYELLVSTTRFSPIPPPPPPPPLHISSLSPPSGDLSKTDPSASVHRREYPLAPGLQSNSSNSTQNQPMPKTIADVVHKSTLAQFMAGKIGAHHSMTPADMIQVQLEEARKSTILGLEQHKILDTLVKEFNSAVAAATSTRSLQPMDEFVASAKTRARSLDTSMDFVALCFLQASDSSLLLLAVRAFYLRQFLCNRNILGYRPSPEEIARFLDFVENLLPQSEHVAVAFALNQEPRALVGLLSTQPNTSFLCHCFKMWSVMSHSSVRSVYGKEGLTAYVSDRFWKFIMTSAMLTMIDNLTTADLVSEADFKTLGELVRSSYGNSLGLLGKNLITKMLANAVFANSSDHTVNMISSMCSCMRPTSMVTCPLPHVDAHTGRPVTMFVSLPWDAQSQCLPMHSLAFHGSFLKAIMSRYLTAVATPMIVTRRLFQESSFEFYFYIFPLDLHITNVVTLSELDLEYMVVLFGSQHHLGMLFFDEAVRRVFGSLGLSDPSAVQAMLENGSLMHLYHTCLVPLVNKFFMEGGSGSFVMNLRRMMIVGLTYVPVLVSVMSLSACRLIVAEPAGRFQSLEPLQQLIHSLLPFLESYHGHGSKH